MFQENDQLRKPSVIKVRRLLNQLSQLSRPKNSLYFIHQNGASKVVPKYSISSANEMIDSDVDNGRSSEEEDQIKDHHKTICPYCNNGKVRKTQSEFLPERFVTRSSVYKKRSENGFSLDFGSLYIFCTVVAYFRRRSILASRL